MGYVRGFTQNSLGCRWFEPGLVLLCKLVGGGGGLGESGQNQ